MQTEVSVFDPSFKCVICHRPPPEGQDKHTHQSRGTNHIACLPCVETLKLRAEAHQSVLCPEECGYDFNPAVTCKDKAARLLKRSIKNPIVILTATGTAATGLTAAADSTWSLIVQGVCAVPAFGSLIYDVARNFESSGTPIALGLMSAYLGNLTATFSQNGFNELTGIAAATAAICAFGAIFKRSYILDQPIRYRYALIVNSLASLIFFSNALIGGAPAKTAGPGAGIVFGLSGAFTICKRSIG